MKTDLAEACSLTWLCPSAKQSRQDGLLFTRPDSCDASFQYLDQTYHIRFQDQVDTLSPDWEQITNGDLFTTPRFLRILENYPIKGVKPYYLMVYQEDKPILGAVAALVPFDAAQNIQEENAEVGLWGRLKDRVANYFSYQVLTVGQVGLTGEHAVCWSEEIKEPEVGGILVRALQELSRLLRLSGQAVHGLMLKDFSPVRSNWDTSFRKAGFSRLQFEPNMVMDIAEEWQDFGDYLSAFHSKARVRVKRARKKLRGLEKRTLSLQDIQRLGPQMYALYRQIADKASFNLVQLDEDYFAGLAEGLDHNFEVNAYFRDNELVGFYTSIKNGSHLDAHFLGFDQQVNRDHQLYLNILLDLVEKAIDEGVEGIVFARTASGIKSSIGAKAEDLNIYLKSLNPFLNSLLPSIVKWLAPAPEQWIERHPFKQKDNVVKS